MMLFTISMLPIITHAAPAMTPKSKNFFLSSVLLSNISCHR